MHRAHRIFERTVHPLRTTTLLMRVACGTTNIDLISVKVYAASEIFSDTIDNIILYAIICLPFHLLNVTFQQFSSFTLCFHGKVLICPEALSINVTKYGAPPTKIIPLSATSVCKTAPDRILKVVPDFIGELVIVPSVHE